MRGNIDCLRCNCKMNRIKTEKLQFGQTGWILGDLPNLIAGAMEVDIYCCPSCRKLEFFLSDKPETELPQKRCPKCGKMHDLITVAEYERNRSTPNWYYGSSFIEYSPKPAFR